MEGIPQLTVARVRFLRSFLQQGSAARNGVLLPCFFPLLVTVVESMDTRKDPRRHTFEGVGKLTPRQQLINSSRT